VHQSRQSRSPTRKVRHMCLTSMKAWPSEQCSFQSNGRQISPQRIKQLEMASSRSPYTQIPNKESQMRRQAHGSPRALCKYKFLTTSISSLASPDHRGMPIPKLMQKVPRALSATALAATNLDIVLPKRASCSRPYSLPIIELAQPVTLPRSNGISSPAVAIGSPTNSTRISETLKTPEFLSR